MKKYSSTITLSQNSRGIWDFDTVKGCKYGMELTPKGCYSACYAASIALRYGYDFSNSVLRRFDSKSHEDEIINRIKSEKMDFIRIGVMGDPSECWGHTIDMCDKIRQHVNNIVLITKHWETVPYYLIDKFKSLDLIVNTSISALDSDYLIEHRLQQYTRLKNACKSCLRIVSCEFNTDNINGFICNSIQERLFKNHNVIDTVLRLSESNDLVFNQVVKTEKKVFMSSEKNVTLNDKLAFLGYCKDCPEMCGVNM